MSPSLFVLIPALACAIFALIFLTGAQRCRKRRAALGTGLRLLLALGFALAAIGLIGLGVTICVSYAEPMVRRYGLEMRRLTEPDVHRRFFVFTRHGRALSPAAEAFHIHLRRFVGNGTAAGV